MGLIDQIQGNRIYLDTNIFVYLFEGFDPYISQIKPLIKKIEKGEYHSITSELTLAEALIKPIQEKNVVCQEVYQKGIQSSTTLSVYVINREILLRAATLRAQFKLKLPDAIHMATAELTDCDTFLTNDRQIKSMNEIKTVYLD